MIDIEQTQDKESEIQEIENVPDDNSTIEGVIDIINETRNAKTTGIDGINAEMMKIIGGMLHKKYVC